MTPADPPVNSVPAAGEDFQPTNRVQATGAGIAMLMLDSPIAMALSTRADGRLLAVNDRFARLVDSPRDELIGQTFEGLGLRRDPVTPAAPLTRLATGEPVHDVEAAMHIRTKSGAQHHVLVAQADVEIDGRSCLLTQLADVTAQRQTEEFRDQLLAFVVREVRPRVTAILGGARVLRTKPQLDEALRAELLDDMIAEGERLDRLLSQLGWLTEITAGSLGAFSEPVSMEPLVARLNREIAAANPAHAFVVHVAPEAPSAAADPMLLEEVLRQLYELAITSMPAGGTIRTSVVEAGEAIVTRISGDGKGIAAEQAKATVVPFRLEGSGQVRVMGLSLYLCRGLVEAQGGRIESRSAGLGHGAMFTVTLPTARDATASAHP